MKGKKSKKLRKRTAAMMLAFSLFGGMLPNSMNVVEAAGTDYNLRGPIMHEDGSVTWDTVYFGNYWQNDTNGDGKADQKDQKEPIRWRVLSVENGEALLLSDKILVDGMNYSGNLNLRHIWDIPDSIPDDDPQLHPPSSELQEVEGEVWWGNCDLRSWLNGYDGAQNMNGYDYTEGSFLKDAFSSAEQEAIQTSNLNAYNFMEYDPEDPSNVHDKVFLLSARDVKTYEYGFVEKNYYQTRMAWFTQYALDTGYELTGSQWEDPTMDGAWWTRTANVHDNLMLGTAYNVGGLGNGMGWSNDIFPGEEEIVGRGVRPSLLLKLSDTAQWSKGGTLTMTPEGKMTEVKPTSPEITIKLPVSMDEAKHDVIAAMAGMKMTNVRTAEELLASAEASVAGGARIEVVGDLNRTPATETEAGRAEIQFRITFANGTSDTVTTTWGIAPLNGFSAAKRKEYFEKAEEAINKCVWDYPVSNNTTCEEMIAAFKSVLPDEWCITLTGDVYKLFPSNSQVAGGIEGSVEMLCARYYEGCSYGKTIPVTETMTADERAVSADIDAIRAAMKAMKPTNKTTEKDITKVVKAAVKNGSSVEYLSGTFKKTNATYGDLGKIIIMYKVSKGRVTREVYQKLEIPKVSLSSREDEEENASAPKAGTLLKSGKHTYKVLKKGSTVAFVKTKSTSKSISIPATMTYGGIQYKVTEVSRNALKNNRKVTTVKLGSNITTIGASAFQGCKKLKNITISSRKLKSVGKKAFSGTPSKARVKVPSGNKKAYQKLLKGRGLGKKAKIV